MNSLAAMYIYIYDHLRFLFSPSSSYNLTLRTNLFLHSPVQLWWLLSSKLQSLNWKQCRNHLMFIEMTMDMSLTSVLPCGRGSTLASSVARVVKVIELWCSNRRLKKLELWKGWQCPPPPPPPILPSLMVLEFFSSLQGRPIL